MKSIYLKALFIYLVFFHPIKFVYGQDLQRDLTFNSDITDLKPYDILNDPSVVQSRYHISKYLIINNKIKEIKIQLNIDSSSRDSSISYYTESANKVYDTLGYLVQANEMNGKLQYFFNYDQYGNRVFEKVLRYDQNNKIIENDSIYHHYTYNNKHELIQDDFDIKFWHFTFSYLHDSRDKIIKEFISNSFPSFDPVFATMPQLGYHTSSPKIRNYKYDTNGCLINIKTSEQSDTNIITKEVQYKYDNNNKINEKSIDVTDGFIDERKYTYNIDKKISKEEDFSSLHNKELGYSLTIFTYDDKGNVINEVTKVYSDSSPDKKLEARYEIQYTYDRR